MCINSQVYTDKSPQCGRPGKMMLLSVTWGRPRSLFWIRFDSVQDLNSVEYFYSLSQRCQLFPPAVGGRLRCCTVNIAREYKKGTNSAP